MPLKANFMNGITNLDDFNDACEKELNEINFISDLSTEENEHKMLMQYMKKKQKEST